MPLQVKAKSQQAVTSESPKEKGKLRVHFADPIAEECVFTKGSTATSCSTFSASDSSSSESLQSSNTLQYPKSSTKSNTSNAYTSQDIGFGIAILAILVLLVIGLMYRYKRYGRKGLFQSTE